MSVLDKVRRWIDGETAELVLEEAARDEQVKPRSQAEEFIVTPATWHARTVALEAEIAQYWESSERDSWSVGVKGGLSDGRTRSTPDDLFDLEVPERDDHFGIIYGGWSHTELAERHGLPLGTVKSRIKRALAKMRGALEASK